MKLATLEECVGEPLTKVTFAYFGTVLIFNNYKVVVLKAEEDPYERGQANLKINDVSDSEVKHYLETTHQIQSE